MPHLFLILDAPMKLADYQRQFAAAHETVARPAAAHQVAFASIDHWGCVARSEGYLGRRLALLVGVGDRRLTAAYDVLEHSGRLLESAQRQRPAWRRERGRSTPLSTRPAFPQP